MTRRVVPLPAEPGKTTEHGEQRRRWRAGRGGAQEPSGYQQNAADPEHDPAQQLEAEGDEHAGREQAEQPGHRATSRMPGLASRGALVGGIARPFGLAGLASHTGLRMNVKSRSALHGNVQQFLWASVTTS